MTPLVCGYYSLENSAGILAFDFLDAFIDETSRQESGGKEVDEPCPIIDSEYAGI